MIFPPYLAMTAAEIAVCDNLPSNTAWMACHYSPYGTALTNLPRAFPAGSMIIVNDRTPIHGHDPKRIAEQLAELEARLHPGCFLLDLQRPDCPGNAAVAKEAVQALSCPVGVSDLYARELSCPVFLPPVPPNCVLREYLAPWLAREVWLEAGLTGIQATVTESGCTFSPLPPGDQPECLFLDQALHCRYRADPEQQRIRFTLQRTKPDLDALLQEADALGVTRCVGLYQELGKL